MEGILLAITYLKQELDSIDEDLQTHIRKTVEIESQILKTSEEIKILTEDEEGYQAAIILQEARFQSLALLAEKSEHYLVQEEKDFRCVEDAVKQTNSEIKKKREEFMTSCSFFQKDVENLTSERQIFLLDKNTLAGQIAKLNILLDTAEVSKHSLLNEKTQYHQHLTSTNQGLSAQLQDNIVKNEKLIEEIEGHNKKVREIYTRSRQMAQ
ncbi:hypothetical protein GOP47_0026481 [Adiantum capillus-veneris]|nr:hypothetical protein GOP47_0026481 [Adiantum capillus-veneris]